MIWSKGIKLVLLSRIRMTIFSPNFAGTVDTRKSMLRFSILIEMRPS